MLQFIKAFLSVRQGELGNALMALGMTSVYFSLQKRFQ